jgi:hypothetical protein
MPRSCQAIWFGRNVPAATRAKTRLDRPAPKGILRVPLLQGPHRVQLIWQDDPGVDPERALRPRRPHRLAQRAHPLYQYPRTTVGQGHGEEDGSTGNTGGGGTQTCLNLPPGSFQILNTRRQPLNSKRPKKTPRAAGSRHQLEPVGIDHPHIADLQMRDHRHSQEGQLQEGSGIRTRRAVAWSIRG